MKIGTHHKRFLVPLLFMAAFLLVLAILPQAAEAAAPPGTCTRDPQFQIPPYPPGAGLVSTIVTNIKDVLENISETMFNAIRTNDGFTYAIRAAVSLYIAIYGILFTFGMVQITIFDLVMRMIKISIIVLLLSPDAWDFFSNVVVRFFNDGTDALIYNITQIAVGGVVSPYNPSDPGSHPFLVLDAAVTKAVSAKMAVTLLATGFTGPYGVFYCLLMVMCLGSFLRALLTALWVYLMSMVLRTLLFGLAPIFFGCLLFQRTRHLFDGWLNQVVNACLQPILLFIFFAFFAKLIEASIDHVLHVPVCWTESAESLRGSPSRMHWWRFMVPDSGGKFESYGGGWTFTGPQDAPTEGRIFPIDIMALLVFLMLAELANRFNSIILMVARELAGATTDLSTMRGALSDWFSPDKGIAGALRNPGGSRPGRIAGLGAAALPGGRNTSASGAAGQQGQLTGRRGK
jgi:type IV secretory pathway VirB6-like protein